MRPRRRAGRGRTAAKRKVSTFSRSCSALDEDGAIDVRRRTHYAIKFIPAPDLYRKGNETVRLLRELSRMGEIRVECDAQPRAGARRARPRRRLSRLARRAGDRTRTRRRSTSCSSSSSTTASSRSSPSARRAPMRSARSTAPLAPAVAAAPRARRRRRARPRRRPKSTDAARPSPSRSRPRRRPSSRKRRLAPRRSASISNASTA